MKKYIIITLRSTFYYQTVKYLMLTELFHVKPKLFWLFIMKTDFQCEAEMLMTKSKIKSLL